MSTNARDFFLARIAAARSRAQSAVDLLDTVLEFMNDPDEDKNGKERIVALEGADALLGHAAGSVQLAMEAWEDLDPREVEPEEYEDDDEEDDEEDDEGDEGDAGDEQPKKRRRR